jgi:hypothetical protein
MFWRTLESGQFIRFHFVQVFFSELRCVNGRSCAVIATLALVELSRTSTVLLRQIDLGATFCCREACRRRRPFLAHLSRLPSSTWRRRTSFETWTVASRSERGQSSSFLENWPWFHTVHFFSVILMMMIDFFAIVLKIRPFTSCEFCLSFPLLFVPCLVRNVQAVAGVSNLFFRLL